MVEAKYAPSRGDIVWIDFSRQLGHEQRGRRPAVVISHRAYNQKVGLALFCPITSKVKNFPFEVAISSFSVRGSILSDQVKSLDWTTRNIEFIEAIDPDKLNDVVERIRVLIG